MRKGDENENLTEVIDPRRDLATAVARQSAGASNSAAMADFGQSVIGGVTLARDHLLAITAMLAVAKQRHEEVPEAALRNLEVVAQGLKDIQTQFKAQFLRQLKCMAETPQ
ncbi:MAG: hypothetical protein A3H94_01370 [Acidobacteria bacterium RIFCSPLOWO2_02_FULL_60_20]|nr:MAG: hypothetical protein A3H94_01370 [Acidobacteria bacterium RIFCSPLOWO2_02_FULL_60_20]